MIDYCQRPFKTMVEMNLIMIRKWNERVKPEDTVFHLGDLCFKCAPSESPDAPKKAFDIIKPQLNGEIIRIAGNHDPHNGNKSIIESLVINYGGKRINLVHNPEYCNINYDLNFCGHCHEKWVFKRYRRGEQFTDCCNVGVDVWNFYPITYQEIDSEYHKWLKENK
ncbi:MAG: metallophosphoesterase family protein [Patescibacteria group bacterium]